MPKYLTVKAKANPLEADMYIDGEIVTDEVEDTDTSAAGFRDALKDLGDVKTINLHINSPGGSVFEGIAIYNMLKNSKARVNIYVDAVAASIASVICMAGDAIFMPSNSMLMIHNPYTIAMGNAKQLRKAADDMDQIAKAIKESYLSKAGNKLDEDLLGQIMDKETWLTAQEAYDFGLCDEIIDANQAVASINNPFAKHFKAIPESLLAEFKAKQKDISDSANKKNLNAEKVADAVETVVKNHMKQKKPDFAKIIAQAKANRERIDAEIKNYKEITYE